MGKYFGTDGFRGEANVDLTADQAFQVGRFLGWYYGQEHKCKVVIGKDTRRSSYMFEYALAAGLTASGADAYLLHVTTTPSVSYVARTEGFDCGIMISASHNPYYDNGIKLLNGKGEKMEETVIEAVEAYLDGAVAAVPLAQGADIGRTVDYIEGRSRYIKYLESIVEGSFAGKRIGLDCANGSASAIAGSIFEALGAEVTVIHNAPNGLNINTDCGSTHIEGLQKLVKEQKLDVGFAYDGDADRCLCVDEHGNVVDGDQILYIYGAYLKEKGRLTNNTVVTTVMSNLGLYKAFDALDIGYEKTAVGDKYVYENMVQNGHSIGGEQSGHIIFSEYANTGDGILTSLQMMNVMLECGKSLAQLAEPLTIYPQVLKNVRVTDKKAAQADPDVQAAVQAAEEALGEDGRILVRESGTEPLVRVMAEAKTIALCEQYVDGIIEVIASKGYQIEQ
ncbi:MAG: phosphoglucosamine mutase [Lachnospiraceae bacterium]|nr:phosphoglucosamine mutase [Lachnospiraceae bacterium]